MFFGGGVAPATDDAASRMRLFGDGSSLVWLIESGAAVSSRVGVGVEFTRPTTLDAETSGRSFWASGRQRERILVGLLRARVTGSDRVALDLVGGAGVLLQHHEQRQAPCFSGCADTIAEELDHQAPAFALGADVPLRVTPHVWLNAAIRWYALRRGDHVTGFPAEIPWQFEWRSSNRFAMGVTGRVGW